MKLTSKSASARSGSSTRNPIKRDPVLLVFGAHPDDIEFGCGAVIAQEALDGRFSHWVVCSRGEAGTNGTPAQRTQEAQQAAEVLEASLEFIDFGGDAHFEVTVPHTIELARIIRQVRPLIVFAPTLVENQHPDHAKLGRMVRDAARLARYGGLRELKGLEPHAIGQLFYYAIGADAEPRDITPLMIDTSSDAVMQRWIAAMSAHASQMKTRNYVEMQVARARMHGLRAGRQSAMPLFPADPLVVTSLASLERGARQF